MEKKCVLQAKSENTSCNIKKEHNQINIIIIQVRLSQDIINVLSL